MEPCIALAYFTASYIERPTDSVAKCNTIRKKYLMILHTKQSNKLQVTFDHLSY